MITLRMLAGIGGIVAAAFGILLLREAGPVMGGAFIISGAILIAASVIASAIHGGK